MLGGNRSDYGIIILYSASEQGYLVLALYKHAILLYKKPEDVKHSGRDHPRGISVSNHSNIEAVLNKRQPAWGLTPKNKTKPIKYIAVLRNKYPSVS